MISRKRHALSFVFLAALPFATTDLLEAQAKHSPAPAPVNKPSTPPVPPLYDYDDMVQIHQRTLAELQQTPLGRAQQFIGQDVDKAYTGVRALSGSIAQADKAAWTVVVDEKVDLVSDNTHFKDPAKNTTAMTEGDKLFQSQMYRAQPDRIIVSGTDRRYNIVMPITGNIIQDARLESNTNATLSGTNPIPGRNHFVTAIYDRSRPAFTISELLRLIRNTDNIQEALKGVTFKYDAVENIGGQTFSGEVNQNGISGQWFQVSFVNKGKLVVIECVDVSANSMFVWDSEFKPSQGNSPVHSHINPKFDWKRYSIDKIAYREIGSDRPESFDPSTPLGQWKQLEQAQRAVLIPFNPETFAEDFGKSVPIAATQPKGTSTSSDPAKSAATPVLDDELIKKSFANPNGPMNVQELSKLLVGRKASALVQLGNTGNPGAIMVDSPVTTYVSKDGPLQYRVEKGMIHGEARNVRFFEPPTVFTISSVGITKGFLDIQLIPLDMPANSARSVRFPIGTDSSNKATLELIGKYLAVSNAGL